MARKVLLDDEMPPIPNKIAVFGPGIKTVAYIPNYFGKQRFSVQLCGKEPEQMHPAVINATFFLYDRFPANYFAEKQQIYMKKPNAFMDDADKRELRYLLEEPKFGFDLVRINTLFRLLSSEFDAFRIMIEILHDINSEIAEKKERGTLCLQALIKFFEAPVFDPEKEAFLLTSIGKFFAKIISENMDISDVHKNKTFQLICLFQNLLESKAGIFKPVRPPQKPIEKPTIAEEITKFLEKRKEAEKNAVFGNFFLFPPQPRVSPRLKIKMLPLLETKAPTLPQSKVEFPQPKVELPQPKVEFPQPKVELPSKSATAQSSKPEVPPLSQPEVPFPKETVISSPMKEDTFSEFEVLFDTQEELDDLCFEEGDLQDFADGALNEDSQQWTF